VHANEIVRVHDGVDETIQDNGEVNVAIVVDVGVEPIKEKDGNVMVDVKEGQLSPLLSDHNEYRVPEIPYFGDVKEPKEVGDGRLFLVVANARKNRVVVAVSQEQGLNRHVTAKHDLRHVVDKLDRIRIHSRDTSLHDC
jgi:hypothetical protein